MKKIFSLMMALVLMFGSVNVVTAAEMDEKSEVATEVSTYATGVAWQYSNSEFRDSTVKYFTSNVSGKVRITFGGKRRDNVTDGTITIKLYVKNIVGNYALIATYKIPADGKVTTKVFDSKLYQGDECMVTVEATSNKLMVVSGYIGAQ